MSSDTDGAVVVNQTNVGVVTPLTVNQSGNFYSVTLNRLSTATRSYADVLFSPANRTADPVNIAEGGLWYESTNKRFCFGSGIGTRRIIMSSDTSGQVTIDQTGAGSLVPLTINQSANYRMVVLNCVNATRGYADLYFPTANRTSDPTSLLEGDFWYNSTEDTFKYRAGSSITRILATATSTTGVASLDEAYNAGGSGVGATIGVDTTNPVKLTVNFGYTGLQVDRANASYGGNLVVLNNSGSGNTLQVNLAGALSGNAVDIEIASTGATSNGIYINNSGTGAAIKMNSWLELVPATITITSTTTSITPTGSHILIDNTTTTTTVTVTNISTRPAGSMLIISTDDASPSPVVTFAEGGNILLDVVSTNFAMSQYDTLTLISRGAGGWRELSRSDN